MTDSGRTLGILVNSDKYFEYVMKLAEAATAKGERVRILVLGKGFRLFATDGFTRLSRMAQVTAGTTGMGNLACQETAPLPDTVTVVSAQKFMDVLGGFDRTVVF